ncbi:3-carboxy-cis,cis-muconate cycloisomerase [Achromobacter sp. GG226]|uniref:lyase family protein n=1 Tax=Verticiella alkaliphila TaxID=2779529 RepID=UPI001C0C00A8|nr:lyase family protein [Verticiella sp. GG226]MBU4611031.1 3-carboxy-cis,cis-muconate cycloisomerase [Verticiella sp. GG226]
MDALNATASTSAMRALWSDDAVLAAMLRFEAELALAQSACGLIPAEAGPAIAAVCQTVRPDPLPLALEAQRAGTLAIPLVKQLKAAVAAADSAQAAYVHYGSTSQDIADTALVLIARDSLALLRQDLLALGRALAGLVRTHARTALLARTLLQPAAPISFGWKAAGWLDAVNRSTQALMRAGEEAATLQLGGANGALLLHGERGAEVSARLARQLGLAAPAISWHGARDRLARLASELALLCGVVGKFGRDIALLMQVEVGEAFEPSGEGRGGSSAMPHKRNPVAAMHMLDAAYRAPALAQILVGELPAEHERGLGSWPNALPTLETLFALAANSLAAARETAEGLTVDADAMRANIDRMHGVVFSEALGSVIARAVGPAKATATVSQASQRAMAEARPVLDILREDAALTAQVDGKALEAALRTDTQLEGALPMCEAVLDAWTPTESALAAADGARAL